MMKTAIEGIAEFIWDAITGGNGISQEIGLAPVILPLASATAPLIAGAVGGAVQGIMEAQKKEGKK